jgi:hypothetical protein
MISIPLKRILTTDIRAIWDHMYTDCKNIIIWLKNMLFLHFELRFQQKPVDYTISAQMVKSCTVQILYPIILTQYFLGKRQFTIETSNNEQIPVEGQVHRNVAVKYLMRRRRSLLMTKDPQKVEKLYSELPQSIKIIGKQVTRVYNINWEKEGIEEYQGSRFVFTLDDRSEGAAN